MKKNYHSDSYSTLSRFVFVLIAIVSAFLHFFILYPVAKYGLIPGDMNFSENLTDKNVETDIITESEFEKMYSEKRTIVSSKKMKPLEDVPLDSANYLGEQTQRVDKETVARNFGNQSAESAQGKSSGSGSGAVARSDSKVLLANPLSPFAMRLEIPQQKEAEKSTGQLVHGNHNLVKKDVVVSTETILSTDEYVYASFYNRLSERIAPIWSTLWRQSVKKNNYKLSVGSYITIATMILNPSGEITEVSVERSSGVSGLDTAATTAIYNLVRVENAPKDMLQADGTYKVTMSFQVSVVESDLRIQVVDPNNMNNSIPLPGG